MKRYLMALALLGCMAGMAQADYLIIRVNLGIPPLPPKEQPKPVMGPGGFMMGRPLWHDAQPGHLPARQPGWMQYQLMQMERKMGQLAAKKATRKLPRRAARRKNRRTIPRRLPWSSSWSTTRPRRSARMSRKTLPTPASARNGAIPTWPSTSTSFTSRRFARRAASPKRTRRCATTPAGPPIARHGNSWNWPNGPWSTTCSMKNAIPSSSM